MDIRSKFMAPEDEFTPIPFWFWNDDFDCNEISRQIHDFKDKGVTGFVIHPRIGIPRRIEYLSDEYMKYVKFAVDEAAKLGMKVVLYDEAMYPSGSAHGKVVEGNPEYASRGLKMMEYPCEGIFEMQLSPGKGENIVSVQAIKKDEENTFNPENVIVIDFTDGKVTFDPIGDEGWSIAIFVETFTGGRIRGIHYDENERETDKIPSTDLLNPAAIEKFIRITHDRYYEVLKEHFGKTVIAMFTDEPSTMGRGGGRQLRSWTGGFLEFYLKQGGSETDLPAFWLDCGEKTREIRTRYNKAVNKRLEETLYIPMSKWCEEHGIALTGHPNGSMDIGFLKHFQIPGQDLVWRWVAPEGGKALDGQHSTMAKCSSDAARHSGKRRNSNECFGCCSRGNVEWDFTPEDMKWYMDWLFVRGVNLLYPHAFYYSLRGNRKHERPPDVGPNNIWWPYYKTISDYTKRMCWLMTDSYNVTEIAVLCEEDYLPWAAAKTFFENQIEFNYLQKELLSDDKTLISDGKIHLYNNKYSMIVVNDEKILDSETISFLRSFAGEGGIVIGCFEGKEEYSDFIKYTGMYGKLTDIVTKYADPGLYLAKADRNLRISHVVKEGVHFYVLVNEGEETINTALNIKVNGCAEKWDAWSGIITEQPVIMTEDGYLQVQLKLERRESIIYAVDTERQPITSECSPIVSADECKCEIEINTGWETDIDAIDNAASSLKSWTDWGGMADFSGTVMYTNSFYIDNYDEKCKYVLSLGEVYDIASVSVNDCDPAVKMWSPYEFDISANLRQGGNAIKVAVTNSIANKMCGARLKSGLIGPVKVQCLQI